MVKLKILAIAMYGLLFHGIAFGRTATLSERASNPITDLSQLQFESDFSPNNYGTKDVSNALTVKPLIALNKTDRFPFEQLIRFKFQIPSNPNSSTTKQGTSLGDTQFFDLFITEEPSWGRWGVGPMAIFPTASRLDAGQGKWQLGPAAGISVLKYTHWQFGFLAQNPISFAGNSHKKNQNYLLFQPFITYHFLKNTYVEINPIWTFDWLRQNVQIPVNFGIGHTFPVGELKFDTSLQLEYMAYQKAVKNVGFVPQFTIQFSFNVLFND